jgi:hypothetical protein
MRVVREEHPDAADAESHHCGGGLGEAARPQGTHAGRS